ncbi:hypothetical protein M0P25_04330 [archaeon]|jgi:hypothetical protein|nr:hypothetical protein [archaeon]MCK9439506.1 hypothetical protein [Patescibacteria group bacterium]
MLGIKYINRAFPDSKFAKWQKKEVKGKFASFIKTYIFNDFMGVIVHSVITLLAGVLTNLPVNDNIFDVLMCIVIFGGVLPAVFSILPLCYIVVLYKKFCTWF